MRRSLSMAVRFAAIVLVVGAIAFTFAPPASTGSPYLSALSDLGASPAFAAKHNNCHSLCEFVAPAHTCLSDASGSRCVRTSTGGCTTVAC
jgi:hypothetical protein